MAIKAIDFNKEFIREVKRTVTEGTNSVTVTDKYPMTAFVADGTADITAMNTQGSEYLNYPAGSAALCLADGNVYILNAEETEYIALGGE